MAKHKIIPTKEEMYDSFMTNLYKQATIKANDWNIPNNSISPSIPLLADWGSSYGLTKVLATRTIVNVAKKNIDKKALTKFSRPFIKKYIHLNESMDDDDRKSCGVTPHSTSRRSVGKPATLPMVEFKVGNGHTLLAYYRQQMTEPGSSGRGKPDGVGSIQHTYFIGDVPPADPNKYGKTVVGTKSPTYIVFDAEDAGKKVWIASRWVSTNNINGDWTIPISRQIP